MISVHTEDPIVQPGTIVAVCWMIILAVCAITGVVLVLIFG